MVTGDGRVKVADFWHRARSWLVPHDADRSHHRDPGIYCAGAHPGVTKRILAPDLYSAGIVLYENAYPAGCPLPAQTDFELIKAPARTGAHSRLRHACR